MKKPILEMPELKELGFQFLGKEDLEEGDFYRWWVFYKGDSEIHITYEFSKKLVFIGGYVEFNGESLKGRELTKSDIQLLIELM